MASASTVRHRMHLGRRGWLGVIAAIVVIWGGESRAGQSNTEVTVIDRLGNRQEVTKFAFQERSEFEYYAGDVRQIRPFSQIDRIVFEGNRGDEEQTITVYLRKGQTEVGTILTGGNTAPRAHTAFGGGRAEIKFTGMAPNAPFYMRLNDVREVIIHHPPGDKPAEEAPLKAALITLDGKRFEVSQLRYLGRTRFAFNQGRLRRSVEMRKIARIDFVESGGPEEVRPVTITLWSEKSLQGTVDISMVRLPGETDKAFAARLKAAFIGDSGTGPFSIGLQDVKQIRFYQKDRDAEAASPPGGETGTEKGPAEDLDK